MKALKEQVIHIPVSCMISVVDVLKQIQSRALIIGADELRGTIAVKVTYDPDSKASIRAISNLEWFKQSLDEYLEGNDVLPYLNN